MVSLIFFLLVLPASMADDLPAPVPVQVPVSVPEKERNRILKGIRQTIEKDQREFDQQEKQLRRELVRLQNERRKAWREKERKARRQYFESHSSGPERRAYVQDFVKRKDDFDYHEKVEWTEFKHKQKEARDALNSSHRRQLKEAEEALKKGLMPEGL